MIWIAILCAFGIAAGFLLMRRVPLCPRESQTGRLAVSVIIPARNEERNLPRLLESLSKSACHPQEVIVIDDASTDRTAEIAAEFHATALASRPLPDGWTGKTWACHQGAIAAASNLLLFVDADTYFEGKGFGSIVSFFSKQANLPIALSLLPYHVMEKPYEELSLFFNLLMAIGAGGFGSIGNPRLFGQSLVITRETYQKSGGHESVRRNVLENFSLSSKVASAGARSVCLGGRGTLNIRMYPDGLRRMREGWTKAFADGAAGSEPLVLTIAIVWITALFSSFLSLFIAPHCGLPLFGLLYILSALQIGWFARQIGNYSWLICALYPIPLMFYFAVFGQSVYKKTLGRKTHWRGRTL